MTRLQRSYDLGHLRYYIKLLDIALEYKAKAISEMYDIRAKVELIEDTDIEMVRAGVCEQIDRLEREQIESAKKEVA